MNNMFNTAQCLDVLHELASTRMSIRIQSSCIQSGALAERVAGKPQEQRSKTADCQAS